MDNRIGNAATAAKNKYRDKTYDRIDVVLPKGRKTLIQSHADQMGESVNAFINRAIDATMKKDRGE